MCILSITCSDYDNDLDDTEVLYGTALILQSD